MTAYNDHANDDDSIPVGSFSSNRTMASAIGHTPFGNILSLESSRTQTGCRRCFDDGGISERIHMSISRTGLAIDASDANLCPTGIAACLCIEEDIDSILYPNNQ